MHESGILKGKIKAAHQHFHTKSIWWYWVLNAFIYIYVYHKDKPFFPHLLSGYVADTSDMTPAMTSERLSRLDIVYHSRQMFPLMQWHKNTWLLRTHSSDFNELELIIVVLPFHLLLLRSRCKKLRKSFQVKFQTTVHRPLDPPSVFFHRYFDRGSICNLLLQWLN